MAVTDTVDCFSNRRQPVFKRLAKKAQSLAQYYKHAAVFHILENSQCVCMRVCAIYVRHSMMERIPDSVTNDKSAGPLSILLRHRPRRGVCFFFTKVYKAAQTSMLLKHPY